MRLLASLSPVAHCNRVPRKLPPTLPPAAFVIARRSPVRSAASRDTHCRNRIYLPLTPHTTCEDLDPLADYTTIGARFRDVVSCQHVCVNTTRTSTTQKRPSQQSLPSPSNASDKQRAEFKSQNPQISASATCPASPRLQPPIVSQSPQNRPNCPCTYAASPSHGGCWVASGRRSRFDRAVTAIGSHLTPTRQSTQPRAHCVVTLHKYKQ